MTLLRKCSAQKGSPQELLHASNPVRPQAQSSPASHHDTGISEPPQGAPTPPERSTRTRPRRSHSPEPGPSAPQPPWSPESRPETQPKPHTSTGPGDLGLTVARCVRPPVKNAHRSQGDASGGGRGQGAGAKASKRAQPGRTPRRRATRPRTGIMGHNKGVEGRPFL